MYDFIFVVLVYRNTQDLENFFKSNNIKNSKVIVVNSYYDKLTEERFKEISLKNSADFISIENKGYGAGNNKGIEYSLNHYNFKYLVISNADIEIKKLNISDLIPTAINAPKILTRTGKNQNPMYPIYNKFFDKLQYKAILANKFYLIYPIIGINKIIRNIFLILNKFKLIQDIYACHGAFIIIPKDILIKIIPIYNENMFLYCEENYFAYKAKLNHIKTIFNPKVKIFHKEDGSSGYLTKSNLRKFIKDSYITFYESKKEIEYNS